MNTLIADNKLFQLSQELSTISPDLYQTKVFKKGEYIYVHKERSNKIFFLKKGRVTLGAVSEGGRMMATNIIHSGTFFGEAGIMGEKYRRNFSIAKDESIVWMMNVSDFQSFMEQRPQMYMHLINSIGKRLTKIERRFESMVFKNSRGRIIEFLHTLGKERGQTIGYETLVRNFFTHQEIAELTGTSRQTVTTLLNDLRNENIITFNRRRLLIRDLSDLGRAI